MSELNHLLSPIELGKRFLRKAVVVEVIYFSLILFFWIIGKWSDQQFGFDYPFFLLLNLLIFGALVVYYNQLIWSENGKKLLPKTFQNSLISSTEIKKKKAIFFKSHFASWFLFRCTLAFLILSLAGPFFGEKDKSGRVPSQDLVIAVDVSNSMNAEDIAPQNSRLTVAKRVIEQLVSKLSGEKVALLEFAGESMVKTPLTSDYEALILLAEDLSSEDVTEQGTNLANGIEISTLLFPQGGNRAKRIIVLTDSEDHNGEFEDAIEMCKSLKIDITFCGIGTDAGGMIPEIGNMPEGFYKLGPDGEEIITKPNFQLIQELSAEMNQQAFKFDKAFPETDELFKAISAKKSAFTKNVYKQKNYVIYPFLILSVLSFILFLGLKNIDIHRRIVKPKNYMNLTLSICFIFGFIFGNFAQDSDFNSMIENARKSYKTKDYKRALQQYMVAAELDSKSAKKYETEINQTLYKQGLLDEAQKGFQQELKNNKSLNGKSLSKKEKARLNYNLGNTFMKQKKYSDALESYKNSLRNNPQDYRAKHNYSRALMNKKLEEKKQQDSQKKSNQQDNSQNNPKDKPKDKSNSGKNKDNKTKPEPQKSNEKPNELSDQQMNQLLDKTKRNERETRKKMNSKRNISNPLSNEKDW